MDSNIDASGNGTAIQALQQVRSLCKLPLASTNILPQVQQTTKQHVASIVADLDRLIKDYPYIRHTLPNLRNGIITLSRELDAANSSVDTIRSLNDFQHSTDLSLQQKIAEYDDKIAELRNTCENWEKGMARALANIHKLKKRVEKQEDRILNAQETIDSMSERICELYQNIDEKDKAAVEQDTKLKEVKQRNDNQSKIIMAQAQTEDEQNETTRKLKENNDTYLANEQRLAQQVEKQSKEIREHNWESSSLQQTINEQKGEIMSLKTVIDAQKYKIEGDNEEIQQLQREVEDRRDEVADKSSKIEDLVKEAAHLEESVTLAEEEYEREVTALKGEIRKWEQKSEETIESIDTLKKSETQTEIIEAKVAVVDLKCQEIESLKILIAEKDSKVQELQETIDGKNAAIRDLETYVDRKVSQVNWLKHNKFMNSDFNRRLKEAEERQAGVLAMRHDEIRDLQVTIEEKNKAIENLQFESSAHLQTITSIQGKHDAEKGEQLELQKQSALKSVQRDAGNINTIECLTEEVKTKNAEIESLQARISEVDRKTVGDLKWELREKEAIIATLVGLGESTKATTERRVHELLDRIQYISREVEAKNETIEDLQRQQKKAQFLAETRIKDLVAARAAIQNLADDYDDLVEKNKIREQEPNNNIKVLDVGSNPGYSGAQAALSMSVVANSSLTTQVPVAPALARRTFLNPLSGAHHTGNRPRLSRLATSVSFFQDYLTPKDGISRLFSPKNRAPVTNTPFQNLSVGMSDSEDMQTNSGSDLEESEATSSNHGYVQIDLTNESESEAESDTPSLSQIPEYNEEDEFEDDSSDEEELQSHISETDNEDDDEDEQPSEDGFKSSGYERLLGFYPPHAPARKSSDVSMGFAASIQSPDPDPSTQSNDSGSPSSAGNKRTRYDVDEESEDGDYGRDDKRARYAQEPVSAAEMLRRVGEKLKADFGRL